MCQQAHCVAILDHSAIVLMSVLHTRTDRYVPVASPSGYWMDSVAFNVTSSKSVR